MCFCACNTVSWLNTGEHIVPSMTVTKTRFVGIVFTIAFAYAAFRHWTVEPSEVSSYVDE